MPRWRAVAFGVSVQVLLAFLTHLVPILGHVMVGFGGGLVAGGLGGGRSRGGVEHGAVTGLIGGTLVMLLSGVATLAVGSVGSPIAESLRELLPVYDSVFGLGDAPLLVLGTLTLVLASIGGGALGGFVRGDRTLPRLPPEERGREREGER
jgi:hypothetical protein